MHEEALTSFLFPFIQKVAEYNSAWLNSPSTALLVQIMELTSSKSVNFPVSFLFSSFFVELENRITNLLLKENNCSMH